MMIGVYENFGQLVGNTPILRLNNIEKTYGLEVQLYAKLEYFNPAGSAKDRVALSMIEDARTRGALTEGATIIEPTSGNTGLGLAAVAASQGFKMILVMPDTMSVERQKLAAAYGARVVLTDGSLGMQGSIDRAKALAEEIPGSFIPGQFDNKANPAAHIATTGPEIWKQMDGMLDIFIASVGTGGTVTGCGTYLKSRNPEICVVGVEPAGSPFLSQGKKGPHGIQGIGAGFAPAVLVQGVMDEILTVTDEDAFHRGREMAECEGVLVGISSGAVLDAAIRLGRREENKGKRLVLLFPDSGERYLSSKMFAK